MLDYYQFSACPKRDENIVFVGKYYEGFEKFYDQYPSNFLSIKYARQLEEKLELDNSPVHVRSRISYTGYSNGKEQINVDELEFSKLNISAKGVGCDLEIFFFEELNEQNKLQLLSEIEKLIQEYGSHAQADFIANIYFFDREFLDTYTIDSFKTSIDERVTPFIPVEMRGYVKKRLYVMLDSQKPFKLPDVNDLYELTREVTPEKFRIYPVSLNVE